MKIKNFFSFIIFMMIFQSCQSTPYMKEESVFILFKTPLFKYADMGFIYENKNEIQVEIYSLAQVVMTLKISTQRVCMSSLECMTLKSFNRDILSSYYPDRVLSNLFRSKPIFNGKNIKKVSNGFTQTIIDNDKYAIKYSVLNNETIFRDTINTIFIKIKRLK